MHDHLHLFQLAEDPAGLYDNPHQLVGLAVGGETAHPQLVARLAQLQGELAGQTLDAQLTVGKVGNPPVKQVPAAPQKDIDGKLQGEGRHRRFFVRPPAGALVLRARAFKKVG